MTYYICWKDGSVQGFASKKVRDQKVKDGLGRAISAPVFYAKAEANALRRKQEKEEVKA